ncbi:MAG: YkgJ family cysteine cluster protein [Kiritimatiellia bacterium]
MTEKEKLSDMCASCDAMCCRYVALEFDKPTSKFEYDQVRWFLMHKNVYVFIDHDGSWYVEFATDCENLQPDNRCGAYQKRPAICREHGHAESDADCEFHGEGDPHRIRFGTAKEFENYLDSKGIDWRWKRMPW